MSASSQDDNDVLISPLNTQKSNRIINYNHTSPNDECSSGDDMPTSSSDSPSISKRIAPCLLNNIATYLNHVSYTAFQYCDSTIYTALRSPYNLQKILDPWTINKYIRQFQDNVDQNMFIRLKHLYFKPEPDTVKYWQSLRFNKLEQLLVNLGTYGDALNSTESAFTPSLQCSGVKKLYVEDFDSSANSFFNYLLKQVPRLQVLRLFCMFLPPVIETRAVHVFVNLIALSLTHSDGYEDEERHEDWFRNCNRIINLCSYKLLSFHTNSDLTRLNVNHKTFPNLTELSLRNNRNDAVIDIIAQFKSLQRFTLSWEDMWCVRQPNAISLSIPHMNTLFSLKQLECVHFVISEEQTPKLLQLMGNALMVYPKKRVKVYIYCRVCCSYSNPNIHVDLEVFLNVLSSMVSQDFMFVFRADRMIDIRRQNIRNWLNRLDTERFWIKTENITSLFVVANKGCKMSYSKRYILNEGTQESFDRGI
eukprot:314225_1